MNIAFIGTGSIANTMAQSIQKLSGFHLSAVASRNHENVLHFSKTYNIKHFFTDYHHLFDVPNIDLIYIATPHHLHYDIANECLLNGFNVLCEKPFTVNAFQAKKLVALAHSKHCFLCEGIWPRFLPSRFMLEELLSSNIIGEISSVTATLGYRLDHLSRITSANLAGGALMDLGIYFIHLSSIITKSPIKHISAECVKNANGVDLKSACVLIHANNISFSFTCDVTAYTNRTVLISGNNGYIEFSPVNNCKRIQVFNSDYQPIRILTVPPQISGYEYQLLACKNALSKGQIECSEAPLYSTISALETLDNIRAILDISFPFEH